MFSIGRTVTVIATTFILLTVSFSSSRQNNYCHAFTTASHIIKKSSSSSSSSSSSFLPNQNIVDSKSRSSISSMLQMGLDVVTNVRCEWISAALCTNQIPRSADVCLILGCEDGRAVSFIPKTIETLITSTIEPDGVLPVSVRRQLKQQQKVRGAFVADSIVDQRADDLKETEDESVDVVISLQAAAKMKEKGLDWKKSVQEAARVLKSGGRFLFVEQTTLDGQSYLDYVGNLGTQLVEKREDDDDDKKEDDNDTNEAEVYPTFKCMGYDDVDLVLVPHIASVFVKSEDAGMTSKEKELKEKNKEKNAEKDRMAELSLSAFERGIKKRKRKKKKKATSTTED